MTKKKTNKEEHASVEVKQDTEAPKLKQATSIVTMTLGNETISVPVKTTRELYMESAKDDKKD